MNILKIKILHYTLSISFLLLYSCVDTLEPAPSRTGNKPSPLINYQVQSIAGGAIITYDVPNDPDIRYVKAVYKLADGSVRENKASIYKNSITVDGFTSAGEYEVDLVTVAVGEVESDPKKIKITTQTAPFIKTLESINTADNIKPTFGGLQFSFKNETQAPLIIHVLTKNENGHWETAKNFYTKLLEGTFNVRGYESIEREFAIYISDRWNNKSDTIIAKLTPVYEVMIDKSLFKTYNLPTDTYTAHNSFFSTQVLWDGNNRVESTIFHTAPGTGIPQHFTFDMGVPAMLSRFLMYSRLNHEYRFNHPKVFELWGSNSPNPDGSWESWTLLGTYNSIKPSGLPLNEFTADDITYARAGEEFNIENQQEPFRYLRWRTLDTWGGNSDVALGELTFYGKPE